MPQERPSAGQVALLAGVALALVAGAVLYRRAKGGHFGLHPETDPETGRVFAAPEDSTSAPDPFRAGDLFADQVRMRLGLFYSETHGERPEERLRAIVAKEYRAMTLVDRLDAFTASPALAIATPRVEDFPPPTKELLALGAKGLSSAQIAALPQSQSVVTLGILASRGDAVRTLRDASLLTASVAKETGGIICDRDTGECFTEASWRAERIAGWSDDIPSLDHHIVIRSHTDGERQREVTLGMAKFGLPDVVVSAFPSSLSREITSLIRLTCQTLVERGRLESPGRLIIDVDALRETDMKKGLREAARPNAERKAEIRVAIGRRREGDPDNRLLEIVFPEPAERGLAERQSALLSKIFGARDDDAMGHD